MPPGKLQKRQIKPSQIVFQAAKQDAELANLRAKVEEFRRRQKQERKVLL